MTPTDQLVPVAMVNYADVPGINHSLLKYMDVSPAVFIHNRLAELHKKRSIPLDFGIKLHMLTFERERFHNLYACGPEGVKQSAATKEWKEACALEMGDTGRELIPAEYAPYGGATWAKLNRMDKVLQAGVLGGWLKGDVLRETVVTAELEGVKAKGILDLVIDHDTEHPAVIIDLKTTRDHPTTANVLRAIRIYGYDRQLGLYAALYQAATGGPWPFVTMLFISKLEPYLTREVVLPEVVLRNGYAKVQEWLRMFKSCTDSGEWPANLPSMSVSLHSMSRDIFEGGDDANTRGG